MPNDKLDLDSLTFDNVIGDGVDTIQDVTDVAEVQPQEIEEVKNKLPDENVDKGDEDVDDDDDHHFEQDGQEPETTIEDDVDSDEERSVAYEIAKTLGFEVDGEYEDSVKGLTEFVKDVSQSSAEEQLETLFQQFPEVQQHLDYVRAGKANK